MNRKQATLIFGGVFGLIAVLLLCVGTYFAFSVHYHDKGNRIENNIVSEYTDLQNILSSTSTTVADLVSLNTIYMNDLKEVIEETMSGRYGDDGGSAVVSFITEQNIPVDMELNRQIATAVQAGRQDFQRAQTRFIDIKRSYNTQLGEMWSGYWYDKHDYPTIDLDEYQILIEQSVKERFETGVDSGFINQQ